MYCVIHRRGSFWHGQKANDIAWCQNAIIPQPRTQTIAGKLVHFFVTGQEFAGVKRGGGLTRVAPNVCMQFLVRVASSVSHGDPPTTSHRPFSHASVKCHDVGQSVARLADRSFVVSFPRQARREHAKESMQFCGVHYAANVTASLPFAGWKPG
jgi:hypothetical protein